MELTHFIKSKFKLIKIIITITITSKISNQYFVWPPLLEITANARLCIDLVSLVMVSSNISFHIVWRELKISSPLDGRDNVVCCGPLISMQLISWDSWQRQTWMSFSHECFDYIRCMRWGVVLLEGYNIVQSSFIRNQGKDVWNEYTVDVGFTYQATV